MIEAKRLGAGIEGALEQAKGYVKALGIPRDVIVTDGIRYRMYAADRGFEPVAYANLGPTEEVGGGPVFARCRDRRRDRNGALVQGRDAAQGSP